MLPIAPPIAPPPLEPNSSSRFQRSLAIRLTALELSVLFVGAALSAPAQAQELSAREIVQRAVDRDAANFERFKDYTFQQLTVIHRGGRREQRKDESKLVEILILGGRPYERLLEEDGKPLSAKETKKEQEKLDKEAAKRAKESEKDRAKYERERLEERRFVRELPDAFDFTLIAEETRDGLPVWKIHAKPRPGFKPKEDRADVFKKIQADVWIDKNEFQWVAAHIEVIDTISWGWFVLRIQPGATISFEQTRVNDEVWLPRQIYIQADPKVLFRTLSFDANISFRNYRKFTADSEILDVRELDRDTPGR